MIIAVNSNLATGKKTPDKKNQGFNGIRTHDLRDTGAMLYQLSYEATHWEQGQFIEFISPYPASSWFLLRQTREKPLRATVRPFEVTAVQRQGRIN